ncbi:sigma-70 family RNA polymerase sigma factor [Paenarthrobacter sp. PH39-S1]|uniref:sigma-70 family RNA polymerase sigma factor n=1 Tax=Paenarthrobacter sp. PH39-S1 TaxID=3046204 RepID=UPI0024BA05F7|nr:sigma-70 family RNA polymerase sigma factor [Paenarthrobacter sp. PH39-S1]MDJ0355227.1 sigma-70 family RNA polymerase sigma factor [Paenarthrobacter sp. PH39-S1]
MPAEPSELLRSLHDAHAPALWRFVVHLTNDRALADDVVQETLLRAWQRPEVMARPEPALRAWLFTVARHLVIDDRRSARQRHEFGMDRPPETGMADQTDKVLDAWLIADALAGLSKEHREVLLHSYYQRESTAEMALKLQIPEGTVKSRLHYALRAMRLSLQESGVTR